MATLSPWLMLVIGLPLLLGGAELLVRYAVQLASLFGRSRFLIGLTVVAFGTSAPEMAIGILGTIHHGGDIGLGNVLGSNIFNVFFVLGLAALLRPMVVDKGVVRRDVPILLGFSILFYLLALSNEIGLYEALILAACMLGYLLYLWRGTGERTEVLPNELSESSHPKKEPSRVLFQVGMVLLSVAMLAGGAHFLVEGAVAIARRVGVSEFTIGLSMVAVGTSLPEIVTTLMAVYRNEHSMAIGNVLGSCIFNLVAVPAAMVIFSGTSIAVVSEVLLFDLPVMNLAVLACLPIFLTGYRISRLEGFLFLLFYGLYTLMLYAKERPDSAPFELATLLVVLSVSVALVTLIVVAHRAIRFRREKTLKEH